MSPLPPGPKMPTALQTLAWFTRPAPFVLRAQEKYGDIFTMHVGAEPPWVKLGHPDMVKQVFTGSPDVFLAGQANEILRPILGDHSVLLLDRSEHLRERKLMLPPFHGERMQRYGDLMREIAEAEIATWPVDAELSLAPRMQAVTLEIVLRAVFGVRDQGRLQELREAIKGLLDFITNPIAFGAVAVLGVDRATRQAPFVRAIEPVNRLLFEEIQDHRHADDLADRDDILSLLLQARREDQVGDSGNDGVRNLGSPMTDQELRDQLLTLLVAGHETTATALSWAFERLLRTPAALERLREEVAADGDEYSLAVAHETLRLRPVLPLVLRRLTEPQTIGGWDLPAGTTVAPSILMVHRRADVYPDPHAFRPERFLGVKPGTYTWIPFGGGVRRCLGAAFALYELQIVLQAVVRNADLRAVTPEGERISRRAITMAPSRGARVVRRGPVVAPAPESALATA